ncbi:hypothetical protein CYMTET_55722 [Cymbomonas tetramitiformis]|uniref:Uncharacterized protein n=1 Tax=Cymbomonas tetramitiformis TaxID=36881 RepID=A0AAE0EN30_9CHLO|nr:hypothetical protein CYMTET_55722 [Cymbomonas tetramitiformis]
MPVSVSCSKPLACCSMQARTTFQGTESARHWHRECPNGGKAANKREFGSHSFAVSDFENDMYAEQSRFRRIPSAEELFPEIVCPADWAAQLTHGGYFVGHLQDPVDQPELIREVNEGFNPKEVIYNFQSSRDSNGGTTTLPDEKRLIADVADRLATGILEPSGPV